MQHLNTLCRKISSHFSIKIAIIEVYLRVEIEIDQTSNQNLYALRPKYELKTLILITNNKIQLKHELFLVKGFLKLTRVEIKILSLLI